MRKWEYREEVGDESEPISDRLNALGAAGWDLVTVTVVPVVQDGVNHGVNMVYHLKREIRAP